MPASLFALGYVLVWAGFSIAATVMQWGLQNAALLSPMLVGTSTILGGVLFVAAGVYQWTPLKHSCLQTLPLAAFLHHAALAAGRAGRLSHGPRAWRVLPGCCGFVMGLLFVAAS